MVEKVEQAINELEIIHNKKCFIVTPIGSANSDIRRNIDGVIDAVIVPTLIKLGFDIENIRVSHRISEIGSINKKIIDELVNDELVIVNLTTLNPNVMYELAVRHATGKPVIIIAEEDTRLPFDIVEERTIFYQNDIQGSIDLQKTLYSFTEKALEDDVYNNPIINAIRENSIIEKIKEESNKTQINTDKYILDRLDKMESILLSERNNKVHELKNNNIPRSIEFQVDSNEIDKIANEIMNLLKERFSKDFVVRHIRMKIFSEGVIRILIDPEIRNNTRLKAFSLIESYIEDRKV